MTDSATVTSKSFVDGFDVLTLRNASLEISVVPKLGAKVVSLKNLRTGREWMWRPSPELKLFANKPGDDFSRSTLVGWDECFPTLAPCTWQARGFPDHGEAWSLPWELDPEAWGRGVLKTAVRLPVSGLSFTRAFELAGNGLVAQYELQCAGSGAPAYRAGESKEFIWAAHPLLALEEGDRLELTDETRNLVGRPAWLDTLQLNDEPACAKVYAGPLSEGRAGVVNERTGDRLTFEWDPAENNTLGLWLTRGGWNGHHHLALEPTNGAADSLAESAGRLKRCGVLPGRGIKRWEMSIRIES